jgi:hypothetical protein
LFVSKLKVAAFLLVTPLVAIQLVQPSVMRNPPVDPARSYEKHLELTPEVSGLLRRACLDCHSNETHWPWYSRLAPVSWMMARDVERGRKVLNLSEWQNGPGRRPEIGATMLVAACSAATTGRMPHFPYYVMHPEAKLTPSDLATLCGWTKTESKRLIRIKREQKEREKREKAGENVTPKQQAATSPTSVEDHREKLFAYTADLSRRPARLAEPLF